MHGVWEEKSAEYKELFSNRNFSRQMAWITRGLNVGIDCKISIMRQIGIMMAVSRNMKSGVDKTNVRTHEQMGTQTFKKYRG